MSMDRFADFRNKWVPILNKELETAFPEDWSIPSELKQSMLYSLMAGGKRIRPLMVLAAAQSLGGPVNACLPVACAVEMVHTYSLIHDDLPAMDDDDVRRGKPTNHIVYGEAIAILAGDGLLTHAFHQLTEVESQADVPTSRILSVVRELSRFAGPSGMVGGQVADIRGEQGVTDVAELESIHRHKTGDMIVFALRAGGHLSGANDHQLNALASFGESIGLAFQIKDDILDVIGDEATLGKPSGSDIQEKKVTFPYLLGLDRCKQLVEQYTLQGKQAIQDAGFCDAELLFGLADYLLRRDA